MFNFTHQILNNRTHKYLITDNNKPVFYSDALNLWQHNENFRSLLLKILSESVFLAYRWETPPITLNTSNRRFEFVLCNSPELLHSADRKTFADYFPDADKNGIVAFDNLRKDATLIVPSPINQDSSYEHLASFIRNAPDSQKHALWCKVGQTMKQKISEQPIWLSTAGAGVAWLHVRLDTRPKYYRHAPYKQVA